MIKDAWILLLLPPLMFGGHINPPPVLSQVEAPYVELARGIQQVNDGDFEGALTTLESFVQKAAAHTASASQLAQAHLYLGIAHLGLDNKDRAKAAFQSAVALHPGLTLDPKAFSPKVIQAFEESTARRRGNVAPGQPTKSDTPGAARPSPEARGGGGAAKWLLIGLGAAGAATAGVVLKGKEPEPVVNSVTATPNVVGIAVLTTFTIAASGNYTDWTIEFGDGAQANGSGTSISVTHVYPRAGTFTVTARVQSKSKSAFSTTTVTVKEMTGTWRGSIATTQFTQRLTQNGASFSGSWDDNFGRTSNVTGSLTATRQVTINFSRFTDFFTGTVDDNFNVITGANNEGFAFSMTRQQ